MDAVKLALQIAAGILIAAAIMGTGELIATYMTVQAVKEETAKATERMNKITREHQAKAEARRLALAAEAEQKRQVEFAIQENERRREAAQQARAQAERQRQAAFERQYVPPEGCQNPISERHLIECANDKIRARREFLGSYSLKVDRET